MLVKLNYDSTVIKALLHGKLHATWSFRCMVHIHSDGKAWD